MLLYSHEYIATHRNVVLTFFSLPECRLRNQGSEKRIFDAWIELMDMDDLFREVGNPCQQKKINSIKLSRLWLIKVNRHCHELNVDSIDAWINIYFSRLNGRWDMIKKSRHWKVASYIFLSGCVCVCVVGDLCLLMIFNGMGVCGYCSNFSYSNEIRQKVTYYVTEMVSLLGNKLFLTDKNLFSLYCTNCIDILLNKQSHRSRNHVVYDSMKKRF